MEELEELKQRMTTERPQPWDAFPDIGLYMDQIISYMPRQLINYGDGELLTSAMVNNYIKDGMLPRAEGKRYSRVHLAYLTAICVLKQVLSVKEASLLIATGVEHTAQRLDTQGDVDDLPRLALSLALRSYADRLACQRVLDVLAERCPEKAPKGKK